MDTAAPDAAVRHPGTALDYVPPTPPAQFIPQWIKLELRGQTPEDRCGTRLNCIAGTLYITGGERAPGATFDVFAVNANESQECLKLRTTGVAPSSRDSHSSTAIGSELVVVGGTDGQQKFNDIYMFNSVTKSWRMLPTTSNAMPARECHTSTAVGNKVYTFGGLGDRPAQADPASSYLADTWCMDMESQTLVQIQPVGDRPCARDSHAAAACGNTVIITGGHGGDRTGLLDDVWQLNTSSNTWRQLHITSQWSPGGCAGHTAVSLGENAILVYGGLTKMRMEKDVWVLYVGPDPSRNLKEGEAYWDMLQVTDTVPPGRYAHAADYCDGSFYVTGGVCQSKVNLNDTWVLALTQEVATKMVAMQPSSGALVAKSGGGSAKAKKDENTPKKITSYNIFCSETREQLRQAHPELSSREIEKLMGQQWGEMTSDLKRAYEDRARQINAANAAHAATMGTSLQGQPTKKQKLDKPGNQMVTSAQQPHAPATTFQLFTPNPSLIGAQVDGNIDAVFNAGYLATVKVNGFTYRALLFSPYLALSVPVAVQPPNQAGHRPPQ